jgi:hypothetical protein
VSPVCCYGFTERRFACLKIAQILGLFSLDLFLALFDKEAAKVLLGIERPGKARFSILSALTKSSACPALWRLARSLRNESLRVSLAIVLFCALCPQDFDPSSGHSWAVADAEAWFARFAHIAVLIMGKRG